MFIIVLIQIALSYALPKLWLKKNPEIAVWSVNKKQFVALIWFVLNWIVLILPKTALPDFTIERYLWSGIGLAVLLGYFFYRGLTPKTKLA